MYMGHSGCLKVRSPPAKHFTSIICTNPPPKIAGLLYLFVFRSALTKLSTHQRLHLSLFFFQLSPR